MKSFTCSAVTNRVGHSGVAAAILVAAFLACPSLQDTSAEELPDVIERVKQSTVIITVIDRDGQTTGTGSGFAVAPNILATNVHVLEAGHKFKITRSDGRTCVITGIWAFDKLHDIALIQTSDTEKNGKFEPLQLASDEEIRVGQPILIVGHPKSLKFTVTSGIVSSTDRRLSEIDKSLPKAEVIQTDAATAPGSSGGCWVTQSGKVIGVHRAGLSSAGLQGFNFATHVKYLRELLNRDRKKMLATNHFANPDQIGRSWKVVIPPNVPKEKPVYSSLDTLQLTHGKSDINDIRKYSVDGQFLWTVGCVERTGGPSAALSFGKFDDFTFESSADYGREGGSFILIGWDVETGSGYLIRDLQLRTMAWWSIDEMKDGSTVPNTHHLITDKIRVNGRNSFRLSVSNNELDFDIGNNSLLKGHKLPNYREGSLILASYPSQYGPRPIKIFTARIRGSG